MIYIAEYIWTDADDNFRSKSKTIIIPTPIDPPPKTKSELINILKDISLYDEWSYDGSSTGEAKGNSSEVILKPVSIFIDPFRGDPNVLVLCDTYNPLTNEPMDTCFRPWAKSIFDKNTDQEPWYGLEQEFFIMQQNDTHSRTSICPLGFNKDTSLPIPNPQGQYYCSIGSNNAFGRQIVEKAYQLCLKSGVNISGMNAEVAPGQWELQIGPCKGIVAGDNLQITRYILHRVGELYNVQINYDPKPIKGDWNGSGCHTNFSTQKMREGTEDKTGLEYIQEAIKQLEIKHDDHMKNYGKGNEERMSGKHETASYNSFSYGVADRSASIRIPQNTQTNKKGYFEDRRPAANVNPYVVTAKILETISID